MERDISPPLTKRRKLETVPLGSPRKTTEAKPGDIMTTRSRCIRIFSWNINGIQSFLPPTTAPITSFFKPVTQHKKRIRDGKPADHTSPSHNSAQNSPTSIPLRAFLARHQWPEVLFLQELKISPSDPKTPTALLSAINTSTGTDDPALPETTYTLDVNLPRDKFNARAYGGKFYGVGTILRSDLASHQAVNVRHADWDLEGRVSIVELRRRPPADSDHHQHLEAGHGRTSSQETRQHSDPEPNLALINVYAVNGTSAPYRSPGTGAVAGTRHTHKLDFHSRLRDECLALEGRGFEVVVAGDLNVARGPLDGHPGLRAWPVQHEVNRADFNGKFFGVGDNRRAGAYVGRRRGGGAGGDVLEGRRFDGVDVFRALRGRARRYTYHPHGEWGSSCDRVDLIVVSRSLHEAGRVVDTDILDTPQERGTSDHVPLWVEVKLVESDVQCQD